jgi:hypothetical protein
MYFAAKPPSPRHGDHISMPTMLMWARGAS